jgi:hypothetical protein
VEALLADVAGDAAVLFEAPIPRRAGAVERGAQVVEPEDEVAEVGLDEPSIATRRPCRSA